jgi:hypothetical protein
VRLAGEILFSLGLLLSWANSAIHVAFSDRPIYMLSARMFRGRVRGLRLLPVLAASVVFVTLTALFLVDIQREIVAAALLGGLLAVRRFEIAQWKGDVVVRLGKYVPAGGSLLAWLVANLVLRLCHVEQAERLAWNAATGVLAGAHVLAGIAKVRESGWSWMHARYQALLVAEPASRWRARCARARWSGSWVCSANSAQRCSSSRRRDRTCSP